MVINNNSVTVDGSSSLLTSVANAEIITSGYSYINVVLQLDQVCHIIVNGGNPIYIRATQIVNLDHVNSLKIQEGAITFTWIGNRL